MEWFIDEPRRGQIALTVIVLVAAVAGIWLGRKRPLTAILGSLAFLVLAAVIIPSAIPARPSAQRKACMINLRTIQSGKTWWASANAKLPGDIPTEADLYGTNGVGGVIRRPAGCPRGGVYTIGTVGENPTCTFSNRGHRLQ